MRVKVFIQAILDTDTGKIEFSGDFAQADFDANSARFNIYNNIKEEECINKESRETKQSCFLERGPEKTSLHSARSKLNPCGPIPQLAGDKALVTLLEHVPHRAQRAWLAIYEETDWVRATLKQAWGWLEANPRRSPRSGQGLARFLSSWLSKDWERYRKTIPTNRPGQAPVKVTDEELFGKGDGAL